MTPERRAAIEAMVGDLKWTLNTGDLYNAIEDLLDEIDRLTIELQLVTYDRDNLREIIPPPRLTIL